MTLKYGFAAAFLVLTLVVLAGLLGLLPDLNPQWMMALTATALLAAASALFADLLERRLRNMEEAVQKLAEGADRLKMDQGSRGDNFARPFAQLADTVNQRLDELRVAVAQNRAIAEHGPDAMWVFHVEAFQLIDVNENFGRLTGHPREKLIGMTPMDVSPPSQARGMNTQDYARWLIGRILQGEKISEPWVIRHVDGHDIPCELRAIHLPSPGRTLICGSLLDVTERLRTEAELGQRREFEALITRLSTGLMSLSAQQLDEGVNNALSLLGHSARVDRSYVFLYNETRMRVRCTHEWCAEGITPQIKRLQSLRVADFPWVEERLLRGEIVNVPRMDGLPREAYAERAEWEAESIRSILLLPVRVGGEVQGYIGFDSVRAEKTWPPELMGTLTTFGEIIINVIERAGAEKKLRESRRILELANTELERSNAELKQFAYIASHDLQEPLRAISGFSSLLAKRYRGQLDAEADEFIRYMTEAAARMQRMITDLLNYSRIDTQAKPFEACELDGVMKTALANLQASISELQAEVTYSGLPAVMADRSQMLQLLQNLIGNAIKFHGQAPPRVHLSLSRDGDYWHFQMRDNGIGIAAEDREQIFHIFRRLHATDKYPGSGIGLAACKRIIERHRGRIWVDANPEGGTIFHFTLPSAELSAAA